MGPRPTQNDENPWVFDRVVIAGRSIDSSKPLAYARGSGRGRRIRAREGVQFLHDSGRSRVRFVWFPSIRGWRVRIVTGRGLASRLSCFSKRCPRGVR